MSNTKKRWILFFVFFVVIEALTLLSTEKRVVALAGDSLILGVAFIYAGFWIGLVTTKFIPGEDSENAQLFVTFALPIIMTIAGGLMIFEGYKKYYAITAASMGCSL